MAVGHGVVSVDSAVVGGCDIVGDGECGSGIGGCRGRGSRRRRDGSDSGGGRGSDSDGRRGFRSVGGRGSFRPHRHGGRRRRGRRAKDAFFIVAAASRHVATQPIGTNPRRTRRARPAIPRGVELRGSAPEIAPLRVGIVGIQGRRPVVSFFYSFYFSVGTRSRQRVQNGRPILFFFFFLFFQNLAPIKRSVGKIPRLEAVRRKASQIERRGHVGGVVRRVDVGLAPLDGRRFDGTQNVGRVGGGGDNVLE
mmetsp:Transcript_1797/g.3527  ORF Transcript_1797/g.3527 Transcript_1797/m.3527 type:complete len:251 (+) Transcript_1797:2111-2863(+)